ncbi:N-carbamoyl-L-amino acid hydrolase [Methylobacterium crusticola]|uniref:N-carbamoyl-L-amino acid hydrolase n=1 Tax=Methylobacterium crusticola TaxID=1697972 RepID=A0ABQ4QR11_9HYPH|nr:allantoate amidohydrolase [Methylobacterium crusticola]GJD47718.1 N-carbamoyl-L-amino acid hydrolase [Methylobacterium crusticola]
MTLSPTHASRPQEPAPGPALGAAVMDRLAALAGFSGDADGLTRLYLTPAHKAAALAVAGWMEQAGMAAGLDPAGTVVGRYEGARADVPTLLLGSHIDTVRHAGRYDGNLGVVVAIAAVAALHAAGVRLPFAIEVLAFGDEEGVRFPVTLTGSRAVAGTVPPAFLEARDPDGVSLAQALRDFGCDPLALGRAARDRARILGYLEVHIEQGPVLEAENLPVGIVTAIAGASRLAVTVEGRAGHAGTVPMRLRRDALAAAAEMVLAIEAAACATPDLVATVGRIAVPRGAVNVIPERAEFTLDLRSPSDRVRREGLAGILRACEAIAARRGVAMRATASYDEPAGPCAPWLMEAIAEGVGRLGLRPLRLPSGAGHDGLALAGFCPIGMIFVRCAGGLSHSPAESVAVEDVDVATRLLVDVLRHLDPARLPGRA